MTSALENSGVSDLKELLVAAAKPAPWIFPTSTVTDQDPYQVRIKIHVQALVIKFLSVAEYVPGFQSVLILY